MKTFITPAMILLFIGTAYGQESRLSVGITGSPDFYNFDFQPPEFSNFTFDTDINLSLGASARYELSDNFLLNLKILYSTRDFALDYNFRLTSPNDPLLPEVRRRTSVDLSYLDIPISVNYAFLKRSNFDLFFSAGFAPGFLVADDETLIYEDGRREKANDLTFNLNSFIISGFLGAGIRYHVIDRLAIVLEPQYRHFFNRISDDGYEDDTPRLFSVAIGAEIKL